MVCVTETIDIELTDTEGSLRKNWIKASDTIHNFCVTSLYIDDVGGKSYSSKIRCNAIKKKEKSFTEFHKLCVFIIWRRRFMTSKNYLLHSAPNLLFIFSTESQFLSSGVSSPPCNTMCCLSCLQWCYPWASLSLSSKYNSGNIQMVIFNYLTFD